MVTFGAGCGKTKVFCSWTSSSCCFFKLITPQPKVKGVQATAEIQVSRTSFRHRCQVLPQIQKIFLVDLAFAVNVAAWGQGY